MLWSMNLHEKGVYSRSYQPEMDCERQRGEKMAKKSGTEEKSMEIPYINIPSVDVLLNRERCSRYLRSIHDISC